MPITTLLPEAELKRRAKNITLVLTDCDGVLTDTGVYYGHKGEELKRFSIRDGMGVELLREAGIETAIITREDTEIVHTRSERLRMKHLFMGVIDKAKLLPSILEQTGLRIDQLGYVGDDVNDLGIMNAIAPHGIIASPIDAMPPMLQIAHFTSEAKAGYGAFRDFADWILRNRE